jgi:membrane protein
MRQLVTAGRNFARHQGPDLAAALTYYAVLAIFPALLALLSLIAIVGDPDKTLSTVNDILGPLMSADRLDDLQPTLHRLSRVEGASWTLALGAAVALYSASAYVGAFARAMNAVREVEETRPFWRLKPYMLLLTLVAVLLNVVALVIVTVSGPITESVGDKLGVERSAQDVYEIAKWPLLAVVVVLVVSMLFHATPNVRTGRWRLLSLGVFVALVVWAAASTGFAFYVANFASYNKTYGSVAGVVVGLLWLWLTNVALLFGAELDAVRDARKEAEDAESPAPLAEARSLRTPGMFPHRPGTPVYGPIEQPVPEED